MVLSVDNIIRYKYLKNKSSLCPHRWNVKMLAPTEIEPAISEYLFMRSNPLGHRGLVHDGGNKLPGGP